MTCSRGCPPGLAALLLAIAIALAGAAPCRAGEVSPPGWEAALASGFGLEIEVRPVRLEGGSLSGLTLSGAWELRARRREFGGFSGLLIRGGRLYAVSDRGWWLGAEIAQEAIRGAGRLALRGARMAPMRDARGQGFDKARGDAEGLAWSRGQDGDRLAVSFERDHRIMRLGTSGRMKGRIAPAAFARLGNNKGLEALAALPGISPDGGLIALAEGRDRRGAPMFAIGVGAQANFTEGRLPAIGRHQVSGADIGPDGRLYLVLRDYSLLLGVSIRIVRYQLGAEGMALPETAKILARFEAASGIDNMEGISLDLGPDGGTRLWLISDDNFRLMQRTLLVRFEVLP